MLKGRQGGSSIRRTLIAAAISMSLCQWASVAHSETTAPATTDEFGNTFHVGGYLRGWTSLNLQNMPETPGNDKWKASMVRGSALLDLDATTSSVKWKAIGRVDRELKTGFLKDLQNLRSTNGTAVGGESQSITDNYNKAAIRELWAEFPAGDRTTIRVGKQQIVWGESDFFHAMDVAHGYDMSWRLFFEGENEEWRKPLWLISTKIQVPEAKGQIQAFIRPGVDSCKDIGNTYDIRGGRWFFQPYRGYDLTAVTDNDCRHPDGDFKKTTGGVRWAGTYDSLNYSLAYIKTFAADPVANSAFVPYRKAPTGAFFDLIHPEIDVLGMTVSGYSAPLDSVLSAEVAFTKDQPYNIGTGTLAAPTVPGNVGLGLGGIKKKDTLTMMLRADKNLNFQELLGTNRPSLSSIQLFNTTVLNYKQSDDLARLFAYGAPLKRNSTIVTAFTLLNYRGDTINPSVAVGADVTNGGGFFIPAVDFVLGDSWRLKVEADLFWRNAASTKLFDTANPGTQLFGYFANNSQLVFRLTRQF
jgi:hypothetical protein